MHDYVEALRKLAGIIFPAALMAMVGSFVRYVRLHRSEPFSWGEFIGGMITAGFAGVVVQCFCSGIGLNAWLTSAVVAMAGYSAGQILDFGQELLLKWLERETKR
ncbi:conserved hypothetical protein [Dethiosulfovibrio peptidovorans DSM 11002]|uniref:Holin n=1 Tax=Dethiosulfovibrio peptidovorans DSM 11002 TaxID=469381 RepID=D2Z5A1_9BACT|nr:phage holin family protein [Dethiosulfovibrio peptidovorans]EFC92473.1 conserved hypothetical protein [Dethiosulfovibrio peptidovorans DSM 11002]